ncbi:hypothetical protein BN961_03629 [Afipia felis]|uniref:Uncharacterized protein n=1 Tax=Afipia felis TaxID=1035 RepID=A0A090MUW9_AFIFE|nr:hypothetical protein [Afipia felis]CEG10192.1 hypothetical protein BN961_03629 [Afipia felis]
MEINLPDDQRTAIAAIDIRKLDELLDQTIQEEQSGNLHSLHLSACGTYIATRFHSFQQALLKHREARSPRKRTETGNYLESARRDLVFAVQAMQRRIEEEKKDEQYFHVQGELAPPCSFGKRLSARVSYRWRKTVDDEWAHGSITFVHDVDLTPRYGQPHPKRKPSAAKQQQQEVQKQLSDTWEHLMQGALYSVRDYFRQGSEAGNIPETFQAKVGSSGFLDNYSTVFWRKKD